MRVDLIDTTSDYIPLALFYLKSYAETDPFLRKNSTINIVTPNDIFDHKSTAEEIISNNPDIIGFSCYIWNMENTVMICNEVKKINSDVKIIVGGPDVSSVPEKSLNKYSSIDLIVH